MKIITVLCTLALSLSSIQAESLRSPEAPLIEVATTFSFTEGPIPAPDGSVYFTDQPNDRIMHWHTNGQITTFLEGSGGRANGLSILPNGHLLACTDGPGTLIRLSQDKEATVLTAGWKTHRFNGPNDLWCHPGGSIYFSDPFYKRKYWDHDQQTINEQAIYRLDADGQLSQVALQLVKPNGLIGTPDGTKLYVADIGDQKTYQYTIENDGSLSNRKLFCPSGSDGMTIDEHGNIYLTGKPGVTIWSPSGQLLDTISVPQKWTANVCFAGVAGRTLFITACKGVYTIEMTVRGAYFPAGAPFLSAAEK